MPLGKANSRQVLFTQHSAVLPWVQRLGETMGKASTGGTRSHRMRSVCITAGWFHPESTHRLGICLRTCQPSFASHLDCVGGAVVNLSEEGCSQPCSVGSLPASTSYGSPSHVHRNIKSIKALLFLHFFDINELKLTRIDFYQQCILCWLFFDTVVKKQVRQKSMNGLLWLVQPGSRDVSGLELQPPADIRTHPLLPSASSEITDHWSVTPPMELQPLHAAQLWLWCLLLSLWAYNGISVSVCIFRPCKKPRLLDGTGLCVFSSVCLYCCATTTPTSQPPAAVVICGCIYGWVWWIFADMAQIWGVSSSSCHIWPCCSLQNRPAAVQRSPSNGPPPPCMNPALTNTSWVREEEGWAVSRPAFAFLFLFPSSVPVDLRLISCLIVSHIPLSFSFLI